MTKKILCIMLAFSTFLAGCGGSAAHPVERYMPGDEKKSCQALFAEMAIIDSEITAKEQKIKNRDTWNVLEFIGGVLIIVPFFFMDCKGSYEAEIDALQARKKMLMAYFAEKGCNAADMTASATETTQAVSVD